MQKKQRTISVDGTEYTWSIAESTWPLVTLRVWRDNGDVWFTKELGTDGFRTITPKDIADAIRAQLTK